jgi:ribulose-bisphosphate carboxylase large chain
VRVERIEADYLRPVDGCRSDGRRQSSGTFLPVPGETPELKARSAARVEDLEVLSEGRSAEPSRIGCSPRGQSTTDGARHPFLAAREHWTITAQPDGDCRRQSV